MKLERLFTLGFVSAGMMLTSCADEEPTDDNGNGNGNGNTDPAAITIDGSATISAGTTIYQAVDTLLQDSVMMGEGEDMEWDFTWMVEHETDTMEFSNPVMAPNSGDFPNADMVLFDDAAIFIEETATSYDAIGMVMDMSEDGSGDYVSVPFTNPMSYLMFPADYGDILTDDYQAEQIMPFDTSFSQGGFTVTVDSLKFITGGDISFNYNGWGELTSDLGTFEVLRTLRTEEKYDSVFMHTDLLGWVPVENNSEMNKAVLFISNDYAFPLIEFELDSDTDEPRRGKFLKQ